MIFTILEEDDTIWQEIWSQKGNSVNKKSKSTYYKDLTQKFFISGSEFLPFIMKNNRKAAIYFKTSIKNQMA